MTPDGEWCGRCGGPTIYDKNLAHKDGQMHTRSECSTCGTVYEGSFLFPPPDQKTLREDVKKWAEKYLGRELKDWEKRLLADHQDGDWGFDNG